MSLQFNFSIQEVKSQCNCELIYLFIYLKFCHELTEHFGLDYYILGADYYNLGDL